MGRDIAIDTPSGSTGAWRAEPSGAPRGGVVVVQEIFGANAHIRSVADGYAAQGYVSIAPAYFDPVRRGAELAYDSAGMAEGRELVNALGLDAAVSITRAAAQSLQHEGLKVAVIGYCWGGTVALLASQRLGLPAISYYGARNAPFLGQPLGAPVQFHFGERDASIPPEVVAAHREAWPNAEVHAYPAGHAFNRDVDNNHYDAGSALLAQRRALDFLARVLA